MGQWPREPPKHAADYLWTVNKLLLSQTIEMFRLFFTAVRLASPDQHNFESQFESVAFCFSNLTLCH